MKPWAAGKANGGATHQGVTADKVQVVAVMPNNSAAAGAGEPRARRLRRIATSSLGTYPTRSTTSSSP